MYTRLRHHLLVPSQYRGGELWARGKRGCGLVMERRGAYFGVLLKLFWGKCPVGMTSYPKEANMSRSH